MCIMSGLGIWVGVMVSGRCRFLLAVWDVCIPYHTLGWPFWLALLFVQTEVVSLLAFRRPFLYLRVKSYAYVISNHTHLVNERNDKSRGSIYMSKHTFTAI